MAPDGPFPRATITCFAPTTVPLLVRPRFQADVLVSSNNVAGGWVGLTLEAAGYLQLHSAQGTSTLFGVSLRLVSE